MLIFLQGGLIQFHNTSELLGQAKNMRHIKCHKFRKLTVFIRKIKNKKQRTVVLSGVRKNVWNDLSGTHNGHIITPMGFIAALLLRFYSRIQTCKLSISKYMI